MFNQRTALTILSTCSFLACTPDPVKAPVKASGQLKQEAIAPFEISLPEGACQGGSKVYDLQDQSVQWTAYKNEDLAAVEGSIKTAGWLALGSSPEFALQFSSASLFSDDLLRDDRIKSYILGTIENFGLYFDVKNIDDLVSAVELSSENSQEASLNGNLEIYGVIIDVSLDVEVELEGETISIKSLGTNQLNLRSSSFIADRIIELLDIADVASMASEVDLVFEIKLKNSCPN